MERELEAVNRFAKTVLTEEQVYIFSVRLCDNEVDRDLERFAAEALETLGELFVGKSGTSGQPVGKPPVFIVPRWCGSRPG